MPTSTHALLPLNSLLKLKAAQLKTLAQCIGLTHTGTKPQLASRILGALESLRQRKDGHDGKNDKKRRKRAVAEENVTRVLSIDMGVRNLAYCILDVHSFSLPTTSKGKQKKDSRLQIDSSTVSRSTTNTVSTSSASASGCILATVKAWSRLSVTSLAIQQASRSSPAPAPAPPQSTSQESDPFSLPPLSLAANQLINTLVLSSRDKSPDTVLIEKQRWRSMSSSAIQQWTVRVNTFEAMLWAVLSAAKLRGEWEGDVWGVDPGGVGRWVVDGLRKEGHGNGEGEGRTKRKATAKEGKREKVAVVKGWLVREEVVEVEGAEGQRVRSGLLGVKGRKGGKKIQRRLESGGLEEREVEKWDDLADCLLQGVAWIQWERNKEILLERGLDAFIEEVE